MVEDAPQATHTAYLGLGSNVGDREVHLRGALELLGESHGTEVKAVSRLIETEPVGGPPGQSMFLNAACAVETTLPPRELLHLALEIERRCGRIRGERWGPRTLDVDILLYDGLVLDEPDLVIPHPRMQERRFVLEPLAEIAPEVVHPVSGRTISALLEALGGRETCR